MAWTEERRKQQAERIRQNRPWEKSTGPRTAAGKARTRLNAVKHGLRSADIGLIRAMLRSNREFLKLWAQIQVAEALWLCKTNGLNKNTSQINAHPPGVVKNDTNELKTE